MYAQKSYGAAEHRQQNRQPRSMLIVLRTRKSSFFSLCLKGGKICRQNGITAPRQEKPAIRLYAETSGFPACAIKGNAGVRIVPIVNFYL